VPQASKSGKVVGTLRIIQVMQLLIKLVIDPQLYITEKIKEMTLKIFSMCGGAKINLHPYKGS